MGVVKKRGENPTLAWMTVPRALALESIWDDRGSVFPFAPPRLTNVFLLSATGWRRT